MARMRSTQHGWLVASARSPISGDRVLLIVYATLAFACFGGPLGAAVADDGTLPIYLGLLALAGVGAAAIYFARRLPSLQTEVDLTHEVLRVDDEVLPFGRVAGVVLGFDPAWGYEPVVRVLLADDDDGFSPFRGIDPLDDESTSTLPVVRGFEVDDVWPSAVRLAKTLNCPLLDETRPEPEILDLSRPLGERLRKHPRREPQTTAHLSVRRFGSMLDVRWWVGDPLVPIVGWASLLTFAYLLAMAGSGDLYGWWSPPLVLPVLAAWLFARGGGRNRLVLTDDHLLYTNRVPWPRRRVLPLASIDAVRIDEHVSIVAGDRYVQLRCEDDQAAWLGWAVGEAVVRYDETERDGKATHLDHK